MTKTIKNLAFSLVLMMACSGAVMADGNAFTPLNFDDVSYGSAPQTIAATQTSNVKPMHSAIDGSNDGAPGNVKMQSAIQELDNAQVDVRNELLNYKAKYSDVDAQYKLVKSERKALDKQVVSLEKRIKQLDRTKEKIRKNMI